MLPFHLIISFKKVSSYRYPFVPFHWIISSKKVSSYNLNFQIYFIKIMVFEKFMDFY